VSNKLLEVKNLKKYFPIKGGLFRNVVNHVKAVDGVTFSIEEGKTLGLVGESGCGKSTLGRSLLRLQKPTEGTVVFNGKSVLDLSHTEMKALRRDMQIIFQDPFASLNPRMTIHSILREPLDTHRLGSPSSRDQKILEIMDIVGLRKEVLNRYPHEFSGGQRQRIGIARALVLGPKFIVADEPVSALDVSVQSQVLNLISDLQERLGISFLFIAHDLAVVQHVSHDVGVMYLGRLVEKASSEDLYKDPKHPYTQALLSAIPIPDPTKKTKRIELEGDVPSPINPPSGCSFHTRCPFAKDICREVDPAQKDLGSNTEHLVSCHLY